MLYDSMLHHTMSYHIIWYFIVFYCITLLHSIILHDFTFYYMKVYHTHIVLYCHGFTSYHIISYHLILLCYIKIIYHSVKHILYWSLNQPGNFHNLPKDMFGVWTYQTQFKVFKVTIPPLQKHPTSFVRKSPPQSPREALTWSDPCYLGSMKIGFQEGRVGGKVPGVFFFQDMIFFSRTY